MSIKIYYMKDTETFRTLGCGVSFAKEHGEKHGIVWNNVRDKQYHTFLTVIPHDAGKSDIQLCNETFHQMQGHVWSPHGEARDLIRSLNLKHTSMSVGDIIEIVHNENVIGVYMVDTYGFYDMLKDDYLK